MSKSRRDFLKKTLTGALCAGAATLPAPISAMTKEILDMPEEKPAVKAKRILHKS